MGTSAAFRAKETTLTTGDTTDIVFEGASTGFRRIVDELKSMTGQSAGPWLDVCVTVSNGTSFEVMQANVEEGTAPGGKDQAKRTTGTILRSSNGGSAVNWGSGTKDVFVSPDARKWYALLDVLATVGLIKRNSSTSYSIIAISANVESLLGAANYAAMRTQLDLEVGVDFNAFSARLADIAALAVTADQFVGGNGSNLVLRTAAQVRTSLGLGTLYDRNIPTRTRVALGSDQSITTSETSYTVINSLNAVDFPGSTSSNKYEISGSVLVESASGTGVGIFTVGIFSNASGDASGTPVWEGSVRVAGPLEPLTLTFSGVEVTPSSGHKLGIAIKRDAAQDFAVKTGNGSTFARILEVLD